MLKAYWAPSGLRAGARGGASELLRDLVATLRMRTCILSLLGGTVPLWRLRLAGVRLARGPHTPARADSPSDLPALHTSGWFVCDNLQGRDSCCGTGHLVALVSSPRAPTAPGRGLGAADSYTLLLEVPATFPPPIFFL